ncbi:MAG: hypothetical protein JWN70_5567 [Planctomycetaceae bacterium]|nr:hypothetical protein [Planctomycetaceae bacterium]
MAIQRDWGRFGGVWLLLAGMLLSGCGGSGKPEGSVAGKVTYNGNPVTSGTVNFLSTAGVGAQAKINNGAYQVNGPLATGEYSVYVAPPLPTPQPPGTKPVPPPKFEVPAKYQDAKQSGLKVTVKAGRNDLPVTIKD